MKAAGELFGAEDGAVAGDDERLDWMRWNIQIEDLEQWLWHESPVA